MSLVRHLAYPFTPAALLSIWGCATPDEGKETSDSGDSGVPFVDTAPDCAESAEDSAGDPLVECVAAAKWLDGGVGAVSLAGGADLDSDGALDIVLGFGYSKGATAASGSAFILPGSTVGKVSTEAAVARLDGNQEGAFFGESVAVPGDVDGDGEGDVVVGAPNFDAGDGGHDGRVYVFRGPFVGEQGVDEAEAVLLGRHIVYNPPMYSYGAAGDHVAAVGDTDLDGLADFLVGCDGWTDAYLVRGPIAGECYLDDCAALHVQQTTEDGRDNYLGSDVAGAGDLDGDGHPDLLIGYGPGGAVVVDGTRSGLLAVGDVDAELTDGESECVGLGLAGPGDVDGDGYTDLVLGAQCSDANTGGVYIVHGPIAASVDLPRTATFLAGEVAEDRAGATLTAPGDVDGDGLADVVVGAARAGEDAGTAYVVLGPMSSPGLLADSAVVLRGFGSDAAGDTLGAAGDVDGDGRGDLLIGGPGDTEAGEFTGAAWLVLAADIL